MDKRVIATVLLACGLWIRPAYAQEGGQIGLVAGYPPDVGVVWHISNRVGVRASLGFDRSWGEQAAPLFTFAPVLPGLPAPPSETIETTSTAFNLRITGLIYLKKIEGLSTYVAPGFSYSRSSSTTELPGFIRLANIFPREIDIEITTYGVSGSFGAQYSLHRRCGVFGEVGLRYHNQPTVDSSTDVFAAFTGPAAFTMNDIGTEAAVGIVLYFN